VAAEIARVPGRRNPPIAPVGEGTMVVNALGRRGRPSDGQGARNVAQRPRSVAGTGRGARQPRRGSPRFGAGRSATPPPVAEAAGRLGSSDSRPGMTRKAGHACSRSWLPLARSSGRSRRCRRPGLAPREPLPKGPDPWAGQEATPTSGTWRRRIACMRSAKAS
jgi:hypothetical protein